MHVKTLSITLCISAKTEGNPLHDGEFCEWWSQLWLYIWQLLICVVLPFPFTRKIIKSHKNQTSSPLPLCKLNSSKLPPQMSFENKSWLVYIQPSFSTAPYFHPWFSEMPKKLWFSCSRDIACWVILLLSNACLPDDSVTSKNFVLLFLPLILALCSDAYASGICKNTVSA